MDHPTIYRLIVLRTYGIFRYRLHPIKCSARCLCPKHAPLWLLIFFLLPAQAGSSNGIEPFSADYAITRSGLNIERKVELTRSDQHYHLTASTRLKGLGSLTGIGTVVEQSYFQLHSGRIRPNLYTVDDGTKDSNRAIRIEFDWSSGTSHIHYRGTELTMPLTPNVLDPLSFELMARIDIRQGVTEPLYTVHEGDQLRPYQFVLEQAETVIIQGQPVQSLRYFIDRKSSRQLYYWLSPKLNYLVVKLKQLRKGKVKAAGVLTRSSINP